MMVDTKPLIYAHTLLGMAKSNYGVLQIQTKDLTHEDSLLQLPFRGNCLNWVMGHITQSRNKMLRLLDVAPIWTPEQVAHYDTNSAPVTCDAEAMRFEQILADLEIAHQRLLEKLQRISTDELTAPANSASKGFAPTSTGEFLHSLLWHETYHVGQTEILRQLAGKNDKVI
jgi:hypothetical protein